MDWSIILVAFLAGALSSIPISITKTIPVVAKFLKGTPWPWGVKIGMSLAAAGSLGSASANSFSSGNEQIGFLAGALGATIAYQVWDKLDIERLWRGLGERVALGSLPPGVPSGPGSGPGGLMPPVYTEDHPFIVNYIKPALVKEHPGWTAEQITAELRRLGLIK